MSAPAPYSRATLATIRRALGGGARPEALAAALGWSPAMLARICARHGIGAVADAPAASAAHSRGSGNPEETLTPTLSRSRERERAERVADVPAHLRSHRA